MRTVLILLGNELRRFLHDKAALSLTFLVPVVLIYIFGHVFGVTEGGGRADRNPDRGRERNRTRRSPPPSRRHWAKKKPSRC